MKAFRFRGERILQWRRAQADAARGEFLRATETAREALRLADEAEARVGLAERDAVEALKAAIDVDTIERYRTWIDSERRHAAACRQQQRERQLVAEAKAAALQLASRHVRVMERLRERAERRHRDLERQMDMKALDELATIQYARRRADEGADRDY